MSMGPGSVEFAEKTAAIAEFIFNQRCNWFPAAYLLQARWRLQPQ